MRAACTGGVALALAVALCGCGGEDRYVKRSVTLSELVGTWSATPDSIDRLKAHGYQRYTEPKHHQIRLNADGTCEFRSLADYFDPKPFRNNDGEEASYVDYPARMCRWKLGTHTAYVWHRPRTVAAVQFQADLSAGKEYAGTRGWHLSLYEKGGRLVLWTYIGDADNGEYMDFVKTAR